MKLIIWTIIFILSLFIGLGVISMLYSITSNNEQMEKINIQLQSQLNELKSQSPLDKPFLFFQFDNWGENIDNPKEYLLGGWIWNYGKEQGEDVEVTCAIFNSDKKIVDRKIESIGNVALGWKYIEISMDKTTSNNLVGSTAICYYKNSSNGINLLENTKEYKEFSEKL